MMNVRVIKKTGKEYTDKNGKVRNFTNFYLEFDVGQLIAIRPCFTTDIGKLELVAEKVD
mgnify:CR=1 FL=1